MHVQNRLPNRLRILAQACGAVAAAIGVTALIGWLANLPVLASYGPEWVPTAPNSGFGLLILGVVLAVFAGGTVGWGLWFVRSGAILILLLALLRFVEASLGLDKGFDDVIFRKLFARSGPGMTLSSAMDFIFASSALLLLSFQRWRRVAHALAILVVLSGLAFSLGYVYGKPLFSSRVALPMPVPIAIAFVLLGTGQILVEWARDISERRAAKRLQLAQHAVTRVLAEANSLAEAAPRLLRAMCERLDWQHGGLWAVDRNANLLRCVEVWGLPNAKESEFEEISRRTTFGSGVGLPGRVWADREPIWIPDVTHDPNKPRALYAAREGLHAAFGFPIQTGDEFLGVVEFFSDEIRPPDEDLIASMTNIGRQIGMFMKRKQAEETIRENEERMRLIIETANDAFVEMDNKGIITDWNRQAELVFGWQRSEAVGKPLAETIIPPNYREAHQAGLQHFLETGEGPLLNCRIEAFALHRDGHEFPVELTIWPIQVRGHCRFNAFLRDITERKKAEAEIAAKNAEVQHDLQIAREFQEALLPHDYPQVPAAGVADPLRLSFHHLYRPASSVGGDFFDVTKLSEHRAAIFLADVMGHGARAALVTAILRTLWENLAKRADNPAAFMELLSRHFYDTVQRADQIVFASAFSLILDTQFGTALCASAGHPSPLLADREHGTVRPLFEHLKDNPALGLFRDSTYNSFSHPIKDGDLLLLFTDGVIEAPNAQNEEFGVERLSQVVQEHLDMESNELMMAVMHAINEFIGSTTLPDDICLIGIEISSAAAVRQTAPPLVQAA